MKSSPSVFIVIPAYNEGPAIHAVIQEVKKYGWKNIIIVDDGSNDSTYAEAKKSDAIVLRHSLNRGKGAAVKTGFSAAQKLGAHAVVTIDADGQHDPRDIDTLVTALHKGYDVVLGTRNFEELHIPRYKAFANKLGNFFTWLLYGIWVQDSQSGIRAYNKRALTLIQINNDRYEFESEIVRELKVHDFRWIEVPIRVRYTPYAMQKLNKQSLVSALKTAIRLLLFT